MLFAALSELALSQGFLTLCDGTNCDDLNDYRPGLRALSELGVRSPLAEAGLTKADVRVLAGRFCPDFARKPAMACLATRIATGTPVTREALDRIDQAETALRRLGLQQVRVRDHGGLARVEIDPELLTAGLSGGLLTQIRDRVLAAGFAHATLDLAGYCMGSMNARVQA